jgi:hypothetical protein
VSASRFYTTFPNYTLNIAALSALHMYTLPGGAGVERESFARDGKGTREVCYDKSNPRAKDALYFRTTWYLSSIPPPPLNGRARWFAKLPYKSTNSDTNSVCDQEPASSPFKGLRGNQTRSDIR